MNLRKPLVLLALFCLLPAAACSFSSPAAPTNSSNTEVVQPSRAVGAADPKPGEPVFTALNREQMEHFSSTFTVQFDGPTPWLYRLDTRKASGTAEYSLHIEGVSPADNPGDVRMVTDGSTTRMTGAGTDNECVQFPNDRGMDPTFILPESLASSEVLASWLRYAGEEALNGAASLHFKGENLTVNGWEKAQVDVWQAKDTLALLAFELHGSGEDPFFHSGAGKVSARYDALEAGEEAIEPIAGCEPSIPLPAEAVFYVRLPGMASFETPTSAADVQHFYQQALGQEGWAEKEPAVQAENSIVLSYSRGAEGVDIYIETVPDGGSKVKFIFLQD